MDGNTDPCGPTSALPFLLPELWLLVISRGPQRVHDPADKSPNCSNFLFFQNGMSTDTWPELHPYFSDRPKQPSQAQTLGVNPHGLMEMRDE